MTPVLPITQEKIHLFRRDAREMLPELTPSEQDDAAMLMVEEYWKAATNGKRSFNKYFASMHALQKLRGAPRCNHRDAMLHEVIELDEPLAETIAGPNGVHWKPGFMLAVKSVNKMLTPKQRRVLALLIVEETPWPIAKILKRGYESVVADVRRIRELFAARW
jgi:DNA-binding CsgD family transcriptional regulator